VPIKKDGIHSRSGRFVKERYLSLTGIRTPDQSVRSLAAIPNALPRLGKVLIAVVAWQDLPGPKKTTKKTSDRIARIAAGIRNAYVLVKVNSAEF